MLGFSPVLLHAFSSMLGFAPNLISCISFYNIFLCLFHRRSDLEHAAGMSFSQAQGLDNKNYSTWLSWLAWLAGSGAGRRKTTRCWLMWRPEARKILHYLPRFFGSFIPNLGIWIQGSGGCETRVIDAYFSFFWKIKTRRLKTDLTLSLILWFNLRLGGYFIWSASSSRTI